MPFLKGISPKVNMIVQLEFKLAYFEAAVQYSSHYANSRISFKDFHVPKSFSSD